MTRLHIFIALVLAVAAAACDDTRDRRLYFTGDSIIARWDVAEYFPAYETYNDGLGGSGADYLEQAAGKYRGCDVVVLTGTNNNGELTEARREAYAQRYMRAIDGLGAHTVYLYSVLPRDFGADRSDINADIAAFNALIHTAAASRGNIVYMNVYPDFLRDGKPDPQLYNDGLHLSPYGYEILARNLRKALDRQ